MYNLIIKLNRVMLLIVILLTGCLPIVNAQPSKGNTMNKFNIAEFNQHKDRFNNWHFTLDDGSEVRRFKAADYYLEHLKLPKSPYVELKAYNSNGILLQSGTNFYDMKLNMYDYDLQGKVTKKTTYDAPYKLTIEELGKVIKKNFNIDIMDTKQVYAVARFEDKQTTHLPYYIVSYVDQKEAHKFHEVLVNGNTGEILKTQDGYFVSESNKDVWNEYLKSLKK